MKIIGKENRNTIEINKIDEFLMQLPSIEISIEIRDSSFVGYNEVWIELERLQKFIEQLTECEKKRNGSALLESSSPEEFQLTVSNIDGSGHFLVHYLLTKSSYTSSQDFIKHQLKGAFELDSEFFSQVLNDFFVLVHIASV
jgi:hypothetical protein